MLKKIIVKILFSFVLITQVQSAESGGMPQLNPEFWISQIVWLVITFGALYVILSKVILPKISNNLESRRSQILENIEIVVVTTIWEVLEHALFYEKGKKKIKFNDFKEIC